MDRTAKLTWSIVLTVGCALVACGDDDDDVKDAGGDANHGEHEDAGAGADGGADEEDAGPKLDVEKMSFFVASDTSKTADLGGLKGADERCNRLAKAAGVKNREFAAYLSAEKKGDGDDSPAHARDRIGKGPWFNSRGAMLAKDLDALHSLPGGDANLFLNEKGEKINGQWEGSPTPNEHDILTGSDAEGKVMVGFTCSDWTSAESGKMARVGHSDGLGPMRDATPPRNSWNSAHANLGCNDTAPAGGAGHIYCFAVK